MVGNRKLLRKYGVFGVVVALAIGSVCGSAKAGGDVTVAAGHQETVLWVKKLKDTFVPTMLKELSAAGTTLSAHEFYAGKLVKVAGELSGLREGVCDVAPVSSMFTPAETPLPTVTYVAPFANSDSALAVRILNKLHETFPAMRKDWEKHDIQYISAGYPSDEYVLVTKFPVSAVADMKGHKISTAGQALRWLEGVGATAIEGNITTYKTNIETGLSEGAILPLSSAAATKIHEAAPYVTYVGFGAHFIGSVAVAKPWYDALSAPAKAALSKVATAYTEAYLAELADRVRTARETMTAGGAKITDLPEAERVKWARAMPPVAKEWAAKLDASGEPGSQVLSAYMDALRAANIKPLRDWDKE